MRHYIIADIHGCYMGYKQLLKKINLSSEDTVMIWGDCIDRGSEPILAY